MHNNVGRNVDLSGIDTAEIKEWLINNQQARDYIKCQSIVSLSKGIAMQDVCKVLGVTRESIRIWKNQLRQGGIPNLLTAKKVGKRSLMDIEKIRALKKLVKQKPAKYGYEATKWTGITLSDYIKTNWGITIGTRAAQLWLKQIRKI